MSQINSLRIVDTKSTIYQKQKITKLSKKNFGKKMQTILRILNDNISKTKNYKNRMIDFSLVSEHCAMFHFGQKKTVLHVADPMHFIGSSGLRVVRNDPIHISVSGIYIRYIYTYIR